VTNTTPDAVTGRTSAKPARVIQKLSQVIAIDELTERLASHIVWRIVVVIMDIRQY
jgi:ABC-type branched-subunit amino acid transport system ATPase component